MQTPQFQQGLLGDIQPNQDAQNLIGQGQESAIAMANQGEAGNQQAMQLAAKNRAMQEQANQQAIQQQQAQRQQLFNMARKFFLPF